ncbi:MAG: AAA family ATPase [Anaerolineae bacterium]|nr:AAA family ATPase [Anaerolineae bacterium]
MILIINGPLGIGKTSVAWALNERLQPGVMLDGDYIGAVAPFEIYDAARVAYLYRTLAHLVAYHQREGGYRNFVLNYVFETAESLAELVAQLEPLDTEVRVFRLTCAVEEMARRIRLRGRTGSEGEVAWELARCRELAAIQDAAAQQGFLGTVVDTTSLDVEQTVDAILRALSPQQD